MNDALTGDLLQIVLDEQAIERVCVRYAGALDERAWEDVESCFTADAVYEHPGGRLAGYPAISDRIRHALAPLTRTLHLLGSAWVRVTGDEARARCYFQAQHLRDGVPGKYVIAGTYDDRFVRTSAGWKIQLRRQTYTWVAGNRAIISRTNSAV
jgi:3-phenylpropionate/cinnamic acid dioxygenase small subunit